MINSVCGVLVCERCVVFLPSRMQVVLDMTFGGGGHTKAILSIPEVKVLALDRDPTAISLAEELAKENL